jgi:hypothetical protein
VEWDKIWTARWPGLPISEPFRKTLRKQSVVRMLIQHIQHCTDSVLPSPVLLKKYFFEIESHSLEKM